MKLGFVTIALAGALALTACGHGSSSTAGAHAAAAAPTTGCSPESTEELYVRKLYDCGSTSVYIFDSSSARDDWRKIAESTGTVINEQGDRWLTVNN